MRKIKAVIFDLGSTLIKQKRIHRLFLNKKYNINLPREKYAKMFSDIFFTKSWNNLEDGFKLFAEEYGTKNDKRFISDMKKIFKNDHKNYVTFRATIPLLKWLKVKKYKIGLISNASQKCRAILDYHKLTPYFHVICISAEQKKRKPDVRLFRYVIKHLKVKPSEVLMVGDKDWADYAPAKELGMHALLIERKKKRYSHSIRNLRQVKTYLECIERH